jgi:HEPN domain-containing protein
MDDFFKTKVGFTIGLLAAVFAFKPLVDSNSNLGFSIFEVKITISHAYVLLTAFLGLAVYFISLQFASTKHVRVLDAVSDTCYSIALATPPVFLAFWLITTLIGLLGTYISQIPEVALSMLAGILGALMGNAIFTILRKSIKAKFTEVEIQQERKADLVILSRAQELFGLGMYDTSVLESSKIVESALRRLLEARGIASERGSMLELEKLSEQYRVLNSEEISFLKEIRERRNQSVHLADAIDEQSARRVIQLSRELISRLEALSSSSAFVWLEKNRERVIQLFKEGRFEKSHQALNMLKEAWINRDGAVWLELSEFFETLLVFNPELIVRMFEGDDEALDSWLESAGDQLFTDFSGNSRSRLNEQKSKMVSQLNKYIAESSAECRKTIAQKILDTINNSEIREIY